MNKVLESNRNLTVDCDDTLIMWNVSDYPDEPRIEIEPGTLVVKNHKNINTLIKFKKLGYGVVLWSQSGYEWTVKVAKALEIDQYVDLYMTKPQWYLDDLPVQEWMNIRIWRDIK